VLFQLAFWGGLAAAAFGDLGVWRLPVVLVLAAIYLANAARAVLRQRTVARRFPPTSRGQWWAAVLDVVAQPLLNLGHLVSLASSVGSTVTWRGIRYRLHGPNRTQVLDRPTVMVPTSTRAAA
jgi:hypothetical protein